MTLYKILRKLGEGGMGEVYLANRVEKIGEKVFSDYNTFVLKTVKALRPDKLEDFIREVKTSIVMRHENIVSTYGVTRLPIIELEKAPKDMVEAFEQYVIKQIKGKDETLERILSTDETKLTDENSVYCIEMEYIEGYDLKQLHQKHIEKNRLIPIPITTFIIYKTLKALEFAHRFLVHRDISPDNILVNTEGVPKLTDFGIACIKGERETFAGKLAYSSPEQLMNLKAAIEGRKTLPLQPSMDIYSLGIVFYELLTGVNPLVDDVKEEEASKAAYPLSMMKIADLTLQKSYTMPEPKEIRQDIPEELSGIIANMLEPEESYRKNAEELRNELFDYMTKTYAVQPTEETIEAYIQIFEKEGDEHFKPTQTQLKRLQSLKNKEGKIQLKRYAFYKTPDNTLSYTDKGIQIIKTQHKQTINKILRKLLKK